MNDPGQTVKVVLWLGEAYFSRCDCDVFTKDTLTITSVDDGREIRVIPPGEWIEAICLKSGNPLYAFKSTTRPRVLNFDALKRTSAA